MAFPQRAGLAEVAEPVADPGRGVTLRTLSGLVAWLLPLTLLLVWFIGYREAWISPQILPSIGQVVQALVDAWESGALQHDAGVSLLRVLAGFVLGGALGFPLGIAMGLSERVRDYVYPTFRIIAYVPLLGWLPLLVLLLGIGETLKIVLIAKAALVPITLNTYNGMRSVPVAFSELGAVFRFSRWQLVRHVVFPAAFPQIWSGVRYGLTQCWLLLVIVEFLASDSGLGYMIISGQQLFQMDAVFAALLVIGIIGFLLDRVLRWGETRLFGEEQRP
ncbi:ABC transporter permease [Paraburkholderia sp. BCC1886]|uniref:ABC transporter permease n=1 Tax=Paraburkholderia sp. BCC1886 TaxID=2562670 RepID=UPI001181D54C|nr:ABC transporter permease [Paraburkholderia sp. BCC1886]